jgi:hypothetical protein
LVAKRRKLHLSTKSLRNGRPINASAKRTAAALARWERIHRQHPLNAQVAVATPKISPSTVCQRF